MPSTGLLSEQPPWEIPASHRDLAQCPPIAALTTVTPAGYPQTSVVWCDLDGQCLRVNTMRGFAKERNMRRDPHVALLCYDPGRPRRYLEVRGMVVGMTEAGAAEHLDRLASKYAGRPVRFFGDAIPASFAQTETPVLCRIQPTHVVAFDAPGPAPPEEEEEEGKRMTDAPPPGTLPVPASHLDLLTRPGCGVFTTLGRGGQPQSRLVGVDYDRGYALVHLALDRQKGRDLLANEKVSLLVVDPGDTSRFLQIRGAAELVFAGARVSCRIRPRWITLDAIHAADHSSTAPTSGGTFAPGDATGVRMSMEAK